MGFLCKPAGRTAVFCTDCNAVVRMSLQPLASNEELNKPLYACKCGWDSVKESERQKAQGLNV